LLLSAKASIVTKVRKSNDTALIYSSFFYLLSFSCEKFLFTGIRLNSSPAIVQVLAYSNQSIDSIDSDGNTALMLGNDFFGSQVLSFKIISLL
jgi:hypothetical protein